MQREEVLEAVDLGYVELYREMVRRGAGGIVLDEDGMMIVAGQNRIVRTAMRTDPRLPARDFLTRSEAFFLDRGMDHNIVTRLPQDADIDEILASAGCEPDYVETVMWLQRRPDAPRMPAHGAIREVRDERGASDLATTVTRAFGEPGVAEGILVGPRSAMAPNIRAFVGYLGGEPVASAMAVQFFGAAGVFWVGTVEESRHHGFGQAMTRTAAAAGFEMGARFAWLGSTRLGAPVHHAAGFQELGVEYVEYRFPGTDPART